MPQKTCPNCDAPIAAPANQKVVTCTYCNHQVENPLYEPPPAPQPAPQLTPEQHINMNVRRGMTTMVKIMVPIIISVVMVVVIGVIVLAVVLAGAASEVADSVTVEALPPGELGDFARTQKPVYAPGEEIVVDFYNTPGGSDWIALAQAGQPKTRYITYEYTNGQRAGQLRFDDALAPGGYEIRVFFGSGYDLAGVYPFRVDQAVAPDYIRIFKDVYAPGEEILVEYSQLPPNNSAWIAVAEADSGDNSYITYEYTNKTSGGRLTLKHRLKPGRYEVRIYLDSGYTVAGRIPFTVKKGRSR
jgi:hypothetical protein